MNPEDLSEVKSSAYPKLERVPGKQNWVDHAGGLPSYIERIAKHLHYEKGFPIGTAIAIAVNTVKRWASAGTVTKKSGHQVTAKTRAQAAKAVAEWEAKKKSGSANMKAAKAAKSMKESAEEEPQDLTLLIEAECLELVGDPIDLTEEVANNLVRYHKHPRKAAERLAHGTMSDEKGAWKMSAEERAAVANRFTSRLGLLEGVATALSNSESPALSVATGYQFLGASDQPIKLGEVPAADDVTVRGLLAQMEPEMVGLRRAIATLTEAKKKSCVARKCKKCKHSISSHDKDGKCSDCAKAKKLSEASKKGMRGEQASEEPKDEISAGDETGRVKHLQSRLASLGFETKVDGDFGKKTFERVKEFQLHSGLIRDGVVGAKTTEMLRDAPHPDEISIDASPELLPRESASEMGTDSEVSSVIADDLNLMNPVVPIEVPREPDKFTPPTARPIKKKRKPPRSVLFKGLGVGEAQSNPDVKELQADLSATGYKMETDGRFGPQTEQTVKRFQRKYGLKADGVVGDKTMRTLKGVSRHLASIDEAMVEQQFANDAIEWADARDTVVQLSQELAEAEKKGEAAWPEIQLEEVARGAARDIAAKLKRLPDGTFAPKGRGSVLRAGDKVEVPHFGGEKSQAIVRDHGKGGLRAEVVGGGKKGYEYKIAAEPESPEPKSSGTGGFFAESPKRAAITKKLRDEFPEDYHNAFGMDSEQGAKDLADAMNALVASKPDGRVTWKEAMTAARGLEDKHPEVTDTVVRDDIHAILYENDKLTKDEMAAEKKLRDENAADDTERAAEKEEEKRIDDLFASAKLDVGDENAESQVKNALASRYKESATDPRERGLTWKEAGETLKAFEDVDGGTTDTVVRGNLDDFLFDNGLYTKEEQAAEKKLRDDNAADDAKDAKDRADRKAADAEKEARDAPDPPESPGTNIGADAKAVKDLAPGQPLTLSDGNEYVYEKRPDPNKPFHVIKSKDGKSRAIHGGIVPPKVGESPKSPGTAKSDGKPPGTGFEAFADSRGTDGMIDDLLAPKKKPAKDDGKVPAPPRSPGTKKSSGTKKLKKQDEKIKKKYPDLNSNERAMFALYAAAYVDSGGDDPVIIEALLVAEASDLSFDESLSLVEGMLEQ